MGDADQLKQIDPSKDKLPKAVRYYMSILEKQNIERAKRAAVTRSKNRATLLSLFATTGCIYAYTIFATKQETFLDDFEDPALLVAAPEKS